MDFKRGSSRVSKLLGRTFGAGRSKTGKNATSKNRPKFKKKLNKTQNKLEELFLQNQSGQFSKAVIKADEKDHCSRRFNIKTNFGRINDVIVGDVESTYANRSMHEEGSQMPSRALQEISWHHDALVLKLKLGWKTLIVYIWACTKLIFLD